MAKNKEKLPSKITNDFQLKRSSLKKKLTRATFVLLRNDAANGMTD